MMQFFKFKIVEHFLNFIFFNFWNFIFLNCFPIFELFSNFKMFSTFWTYLQFLNFFSNFWSFFSIFFRIFEISFLSVANWNIPVLRNLLFKNLWFFSKKNDRVSFSIILTGTDLSLSGLQINFKWQLFYFFTLLVKHTFSHFFCSFL